MDVPAVRDLLDFTGKTVVVTGAGAGLGAGIALRFAEAGAAVVVNYRRSQAEARALVARIEAGGGRALAVQADVTVDGEAGRLVAEAAEAFGRVDVLINNAGAYPVTPLLDLEAAEWERVVALNLSSAHLGTRAAAAQMVKQGSGGAIVNVASIEAANPAAGHAHYGAAKAGMVMYTRVAAQELGRPGIRVNAVSPGVIWREGLDEAWPEGAAAYRRAVPLGRLGLADDVADACLFLSSPAARWITGADLLVDGGILTNRAF
jgi:3-oxoacyl-[acyl-carrier protein] reductase